MTGPAGVIVRGQCRWLRTGAGSWRRGRRRRRGPLGVRGRESRGGGRATDAAATGATTSCVRGGSPAGQAQGSPTLPATGCARGVGGGGAGGGAPGLQSGGARPRQARGAGAQRSRWHRKLTMTPLTSIVRCRYQRGVVRVRGAVRRGARRPTPAPRLPPPPPLSSRVHGRAHRPPRRVPPPEGPGRRLRWLRARARRTPHADRRSDSGRTGGPVP